MKIKIISVLAVGLFMSARGASATFPVPNDTHYDRQSDYLEQVRVPEAWELTIGSEDVVIAVIDSGVDMDHPDILSNIYFNRGEIPLNGIDDDHNGYVDDFSGWDFIENSSDPHPKFDDNYSFGGVNHGTVVAGVAASATNNNEGLVGACWKCKIMPLRGLDAIGQGTTDTIARAIDYAIDNGADIINMSFVGSGTDDVLDAAIERAYKAGLILVAAVGNDGDGEPLIVGDLDYRPLYPVCEDGLGTNRILGVGSVESNNAKSSFSNFGFSCIDINAPGHGVAGPQVIDPRYGKDFESEYRGGWSGTSFSAPIVSGVVGLMKSINEKLTQDQVVSIIRETGENIDGANPLYIGQLGGGLLDAKAAVEKAADTLGAGSGARSTRAPKVRDVLFSSGAGKTVEAIRAASDGTEKIRWNLYPDFFRGGAEVVYGDVNGDGVDEIISGAGPGGGPQVRIFNEDGTLFGQFFAYDSSFRGGVHVASADIDRDGSAEIVTAAGAGLSPEVRVFTAQGQQKRSFTVTAKDLSGGVTVAAADIDGDGSVEIITGTGGGSLPLVQIFDTVGNKKESWLAYPAFFRGGVNVAVGDVDGDGVMEVVTAAGLGGGPQVRIFGPTGVVLRQFFAFEDSFRGGATVGTIQAGTGSKSSLVAGSGPGRSAEVRIFSIHGNDIVQDSVFTPFGAEYHGGIFIGR